MVNDTYNARLEEQVISLGYKTLEVAKNTKRELLSGDTPIPLQLMIDSKRRRIAVLETVKRSSEFSEVRESISVLPDFLNETQNIIDIIDEFAADITTVIGDGNYWDQAWVEHEMTQMTKAFLMGVFTPIPSSGILIPIQNISLDDFQLNLGEFGIIRRATYAERAKFTIFFPGNDLTIPNSRFKYLLDIGEVTDPNTLFPFPYKYLNDLESIIFALRVFYGGYAGVNYIHYWSASKAHQNEEAIFSIPISHHLKSRFIPVRQDRTSAYGRDAVLLTNTIRKICELNEDSFYVQAFRRYGVSLYTLEFGFGDAVVDSVIALECLFGDNKANAIPRILEITRPKKQDILLKLDSGMFGELRGIEHETLLARCWTARHKIAHGKSSDVAKKEAKMDSFYLSKIAQLFLRYSLLCASDLGFPEREDLHAHLDQRIASENSV